MPATFNILPAKKRFTLLKTFWVVLIIHLILLAWVMTVLSLTPPASNKYFGWDDLFSTYTMLGSIAGIVFYTFFAYAVLNWYYHLIAEKKGFAHYLVITLLIPLVLIAYILIDDLFRPAKASDTNSPWTVISAISLYLIFMVLTAGPGLLIASIANLRDEKKQRKILEEEKLQLEMEKSSANLNFLKAQINPHFLHNTLNFLYAKSLPYSPELSEGILTLSDIMRYALSDPNLKDGKANLKEEIEHVRNVIRIHQLRYNNNLHVNFEVNGVINGTTIIPFVLITIVENAFKHGDLKSTEYPININLTIDNNNLYFYCRNKKKNGPKEFSTGIGLDNIKKRLDLAYKDQYTLDIKDERELYTTQLTIHSL